MGFGFNWALYFEELFFNLIILAILLRSSLILTPLTKVITRVKNNKNLQLYLGTYGNIGDAAYKEIIKNFL